MAETSSATPVISSRRAVEECVELARSNRGQSFQADHIDPTDLRTTPRVPFTHHIHYCPCSTLSEDRTRPAQALDISLSGIGLWCSRPLAEGFVVHVRLPLLDGKAAWVRGRVVYCRPGVELYRVGIAFLLDEEQSPARPAYERRRQSPFRLATIMAPE